MEEIARELGGSIDDSGFGYTVKANNVAGFHYYEIHVHEISDDNTLLSMGFSLADIDYDDEELVEKLKETRPNIDNEFIWVWDEFVLNPDAVNEAYISRIIKTFDGKIREIAAGLDIVLAGSDEERIGAIQKAAGEEIRTALEKVL